MLLSRHRRALGVALLAALLTLPVPGAAPAVALDGEESQFIWPTTGRITQPYGCTGFVWEPRRGSCAHFHGGIDVANTRGTPIRAADDGVIAHVGWDPWLPRSMASWVVIVGHGDGLQTMYAHMRDKEMTGIKPGTRVMRGQIIGLMDSTGLSTGSHLHFSVLRNGSFVDPRPYLSGQPSRGKPRGSTVPEPTECSNFGAGYGAWTGGLTAAVTETEGGSAACSA